MKAYIRASVVSLAIVTLTLNINIDAQAQNTDAPRKPIAESSLTLPDYFGLYAVQENGQMIVFDKPVQRLDEPPTLTLPAGVEFLLYGKDADPSAIHLIAIPAAQPQKPKQQDNKQFSWDDWMQQTQVDGPADFQASMTGIPRGSKEGKLLVKPISNQAMMLRMIPAGILPNGIYQIGTPEGTWYRFVVGPMPASNARGQHGIAESSVQHTPNSQGENRGADIFSGSKSLFRKPDKQVKDKSKAQKNARESNASINYSETPARGGGKTCKTFKEFDSVKMQDAVAAVLEFAKKEDEYFRPIIAENGGGFKINDTTDSVVSWVRSIPSVSTFGRKISDSTTFEVRMTETEADKLRVDIAIDDFKSGSTSQDTMIKSMDDILACISLKRLELPKTAEGK